MKKTKPAIFAGPLGWGRVELRELMEMTGIAGPELVERFFDLSKDAQYGVLAIALPEDYPGGATQTDVPRCFRYTHLADSLIDNCEEIHSAFFQ